MSLPGVAMITWGFFLLMSDTKQLLSWRVRVLTIVICFYWISAINENGAEWAELVDLCLNLNGEFSRWLKDDSLNAFVRNALLSIFEQEFLQGQQEGESFASASAWPIASELALWSILTWQRVLFLPRKVWMLPAALGTVRWFRSSQEAALSLVLSLGMLTCLQFGRGSESRGLAGS